MEVAQTQQKLETIEHIIQTTKLDAKEKVLYLYLYTVTAKAKPFPDYPELMEATGISSRATLSKYLKLLSDKDLLHVEENYSHIGLRMRNSYRLEKNIAHLTIDMNEISTIVEDLKRIIDGLAYTLSEDELTQLVLSMYKQYGEHTYRELVIRCTRLTLIQQVTPFKSLMDNDNRQSPLEAQFKITFPDLSAQDRITFERLCRHYPLEIIHFALESVATKPNQRNWGYITAMLKKLVMTCATYEECVNAKQHYYQQADRKQKKAKQNSRQKQHLIMRLIAIGMFGEVNNPAGYAKKIQQDEKYIDLDVFDLFEILTGEHHLNANDFDPLVFDIMYHPQSA